MLESLLLLLPVLGVTVHATPWQGSSFLHPGWSSADVYTPDQPKPSWHHSYSIGFSHTVPWVAPTGNVSSTAGSGALSTASVTKATATSPTTIVTSAPTTPSSSIGSSPSAGPAGNACASVSQLVASFSSVSPRASATVPAQIAYECLNSVPFNQSAAAALMQSIRPYINWQTTISYLRNPPKDYVEKIQPAYDFWDTFDAIEANVAAGAYASEYDFGWDLYESTQKAHDGHFAFVPDSVGSVFTFGRSTALVSVSEDGHSLPVIYAYADVLAASFGNSSFQASPIVQIDGQNVTDFLLDWSQYGSLQDRDALWNNVFYIPAQVSLGTSGTGTGTFSGSGRGRYVYPGAATTFTFANGSTATNENFARVLKKFKQINSGEDIYQQYFAVGPDALDNALQIALSSASSTSTSAAPNTSTSAATSSTPAPGYPSPVVRQSNNLNGGYFLDQPGFENVAVLTVPSFVSNGDAEVEFQNVNSEFIAAARAANKTKLIIDLSANGGGTILQGYDLFKQLFPSIEPYGATRFRAHEAFDVLGQEYSRIAGNYTRDLNQSSAVREILSSAWNYRTDVDVNGKAFTSWPEKYGPYAYGPANDNFTSIIRWNLTDVLTPDNSGGIYISGYGNRSNVTVQPFAAKDIILVYDGYCASTCTIFSELMRQQAGVKTIALGGRPNYDIIQAVGGVKGTNDYPYSYILSSAATAFQNASDMHRAELERTDLSNYTNLPMQRSSSGPVVNSRDGIRQGDTTNTPLQFVYEPADCRIFYTPAMVVDQSAVWRTVASTVWGNTNACVAGSNKFYADVDKRDVDGVRELQPVRRDIDVEAAWEGLNVHTGDGIVSNGDSYMLP